MLNFQKKTQLLLDSQIILSPGGNVEGPKP